MSDEVRASYDELEQVAQRFARAQSEIQQMLQSVRGAMEPLENGSWIGRGSDAFFREMRSLVLPSVTRLQSALGEASTTTKNISQTMKQADEEAAAPFRIS
ncbi:MAG: WXG100 family type VII secretion target [Anaerolineales bacterium]|nr:WXG100 family type VII secretion target [Anaerolineales bacterium]